MRGAFFIQAAPRRAQRGAAKTRVSTRAHGACAKGTCSPYAYATVGRNQGARRIKLFGAHAKNAILV
ncbi:hypothetical protein CE91St31_15060 [Raoultibacter timonensis]|nr:hypothetical protein CE91St31_15060 [Raoultibacter timonensis]